MSKTLHSAPDNISLAARPQAAQIEDLCAAIETNDRARFDSTLPGIEDLDACNNRILKTCLEHNRFAMAKKLLARGIASSYLLVQLEKACESAHYAYMKAPGGKDREELQRYQETKILYDRLSMWKTTFDKDIMPVLSMQKIEDLHAQIAALRQEIAEITAPARNVLKKPASPSATSPCIKKD